MTPKDVPAPRGVRYHGEKPHHVITINVINITKNIEAARITSRLNLRIRLSYACVQPISPPLTGVLPNAPNNALAFAFRI
jgi:hypothetical protein